MAEEPSEIVELKQRLGQRLADLRKAAQATQRDLARHTFVDRTYVSHTERGHQIPERSFWLAADEYLGAGGSLRTAYDELATAQCDARQAELDALRARHRETTAGWRDTETPMRHTSAAAPALESLRGAVLGHSKEPDVEPVASAGVTELELAAVQAHLRYQRAEYDGAARLLTLLIDRVDRALNGEPAAAPATRAVIYLAAAKLATKLGDAALAWVTADRCLRFAVDSGRADLVGIARYQVACALLSAGHAPAALRTVAAAIDCLGSSKSLPAGHLSSVHGALLLLSAVLAARQGDRRSAKNRLREASHIAGQLGDDANWLWTAFGPTNVAIHTLSVYVALDDSSGAHHLGDTIDTDRLPPVLRGRRSQVHLDLGWASAGNGDDGLAVLHLLEAERVAPQVVSHNTDARRLLETLLARERKGTTPGLRALATRAGAFA